MGIRYLWKDVFMSYKNDKDNYYAIYTKEELIKAGLSIPQDNPETIEIGGIKYNKQVVDDLLKSIK